jgi:hypothetical protein
VAGQPWPPRRDEIDQIEGWVQTSSREELTIVTLHHHPLPLPEDSLPERLVSRLGSASNAELLRGPELVRRLCGRCDLLLHGHRHVPREVTLCLNERPRPLRIFNAGSSTELGLIRVFPHARGRLTGDPYWISAQLERAPAPAKARSSQAIRSAVRAFGLF